MTYEMILSGVQCESMNLFNTIAQHISFTVNMGIHGFVFTSFHNISSHIC